MTKKLPKIQCEICACKDKEILHKHHIIERTEINTNNEAINLAVLCPSCHSKIHSKLIQIIGIYPSTKLPYRRTIIYTSDGKPNVEGITEPYAFTPTKQMIIPEKNGK